MERKAARRRSPTGNRLEPSQNGLSFEYSAFRLHDIVKQPHKIKYPLIHQKQNT